MLGTICRNCFRVSYRRARVAPLVACLFVLATQLLLVYHVNRDLGIPDELFTFGDDVVLTVLGQIAFMPTLVLAARLCPPGVEGTLFALLMSIFNGGGIVGSELGALLTRAMGVTDVDFRNLGMLIAVCNLSSLLPLPFLKWIDGVEESAKVEQPRHDTQVREEKAD